MPSEIDGNEKLKFKLHPGHQKTRSSISVEEYGRLGARAPLQVVTIHPLIDFAYLNEDAQFLSSAVSIGHENNISSSYVYIIFIREDNR